MSRKTATFSMSEETYDRLKTHFPENTGSEANIIALLDALESEHADSEELNQLRAANQELTSKVATLEQINQSLNQSLHTQTGELEERDKEIESLRQATGTLDEQNAQLAEIIKGHEQIIQQLEAKEVNWEQISTTLQPFTVSLLNETAHRLSERFKREVSPMSILVDMFLRYTLERNAEWFYPFVLKESDIVSIARNHNENIVSISQIKKAILGK